MFWALIFTLACRDPEQGTHPDCPAGAANLPASCGDGRPRQKWKLSVDMVPRPDDSSSGKLRLLGFSELDVDGMPREGTVPADVVLLAEAPGAWPVEVEAGVLPGLSYFAAYGKGVTSLPTDRVSPPVKLAGPQDFLIGTGSFAEKNVGRIQLSLTGVAPGSGKLFLLAFSETGSDGLPPKNRPPTHMIELQAPERWPLELSLSPGHTWYLVLGEGESPGPGDRISAGARLEAGAQHLVFDFSSAITIPAEAPR